MKTLGTLITLSFILLSCQPATESDRQRLDFTAEWKFILQDSAIFVSPNYSDQHWRDLDLPHDWSIEGEFREDHPAGTGGGALPGGTGWYRKSFSLPLSDAARKIYITFDGIYRNGEVYINGKQLGKRPNGYLGVQYDLTPHLHFGDQANLLAVRVDNSDQPNSRWYSGSGIYRNVWLEKTHAVHVAFCGTHVQQHQVSESRALLQVGTEIRNSSGMSMEISLETRLLDRDSRVVVSHTEKLELKGKGSPVNQELYIEDPSLWDPSRPYLYTLQSIITAGGRVVDLYETAVGIRYFSFDPERGFILNGKPVKIKGVCMHHDLGALGAAVNVRAMERQLEILKDMGCNGIRTAHNPPAPELLDLCDRMGFIVMDETFDMWRMKKSEYDYALYWDQWYRRDLEDHLRRDRNHPSVLIWSIGNEILEQWDTSGTAMASELAAIVRTLAPGILVTAGCNDPQPANFLIQSGALDLIGYNYKHEEFQAFPETFPGQCFIASETTSALQSRGSYDMPSDSVRLWPVRWDIPFHDGNADQSCSAYDNCRTPWGSTHEESWSLVKRHDYLSGLFIWTGFDYLGEPTPYQWPSRSSYFGIVDLAGFPKDVYYMYQSEWTEKDVLHLLPHWNWDEGQKVDVWAYTNCMEVELFINDISQGKRIRGKDDLHLQWDCSFVPGTLRAVGTTSKGKQMEAVWHTAGEASRIRLEADRDVIRAGGKDLCFVTASILDEDGHAHPLAGNQLTFKLSGDASLAGVDNGCQTSHHSFRGNTVHAYHGKALAIIRAGQSKGTVVLEATAPGLEPARVEISTN